MVQWHGVSTFCQAGITGGELKRCQTCESRTDVGEILLLEDLLHGFQCLTTALSGGLRTLNQNRSVEVVVIDHRWGAAEIGAGELRHLNQGSVSVMNVDIENVVEVLALLRRSLHIDVADLSAFVGDS